MKAYTDKAGKTRDLNERQRKFCQLYVYGVDEKGEVDEQGRGKHPALADVYALAGYEVSGYTRKSLQEKASQLFRKDHVQAYIKQIRDERDNAVAEKVEWTRAKMLEELREIFSEAKNSTTKQCVGKDGDEFTCCDASAANVALKAAAQVAEMMGFNEPEKKETVVKLDYGGVDISQWAK